MLRSGLRPGTTVAVAVAALVLSWAAGRWWLAAGHQPLRVTWVAGAVLLVMAVVVLAAGRPLRRLQAGGPLVPPLVAARVLGLAQASALTGAVVGGAYLGQVLLLLPDLDLAGRGGVAARHGLAGVGGLLVTAAGLIVQRWCRVPPSDDESGSATSA